MGKRKTTLIRGVVRMDPADFARVEVSGRLFSPGEVMKLTGVTYRKLHYWHKEGVLAAVHERGIGTKAYSATDVMWIGTIDRMRLSGFSLTEIREILRQAQELKLALLKPIYECRLVIVRKYKTKTEFTILLVAGTAAMASSDNSKITTFNLGDYYPTIDRLRMTLCDNSKTDSVGSAMQKFLGGDFAGVA